MVNEQKRKREPVDGMDGAAPHPITKRKRVRWRTICV